MFATVPKFLIPLLAALVGAQAAVGVAVVSTGVVGDAEPVAVSAQLKVLNPRTERKAVDATDFVDAAGGGQVGAGDTLRTDGTGKAQLDYPDGSLTRLAENTTFAVAELAEADGANRIKVRLDVGRTWHRVVKATASEGIYEVETPVATAAVRGTAFVVECNPEKSCVFTVVEGEVEIRPTNGDPIRLQAGQRVTVGADGRSGAVENPGIDALRADPYIAENLALDAQQGFDLAADPTTTTSPPTAPPKPQLVAFLRDPDGVQERPADLFVVAADGTSERRIATGVADLDFDVSPDGTTIAFTRDPDGRGGRQAANIFLVGVDGQNDRRLTEGRLASFSPDGRTVVHARELPHTNPALSGETYTELFAIGFDGQGARRITNTGAEAQDLGASGPQGRAEWARDGRHVVLNWASGSSGVWRAVRIDPPAALDGFGDAKFAPGPPAASPDGSRVSVSGLFGVTVADFDGSNTKSFDPHASTCEESVQHVSRFSWAADGSRLVGTVRCVNSSGQGEERVITLNADASSPKVLASVRLDDSGGSDTVFTPDGASVLFSAGNEVRIVPAAGGAARDLFDAPGNDDALGELSPDGTQRLVTTADGVYVVAPDGSGLRRLAAGSYATWVP